MTDGKELLAKKPKPLTRDQLIEQGLEREKEIARLTGLLAFKDREDERVRREIEDLLAPKIVMVVDQSRDTSRNNPYRSFSSHDTGSSRLLRREVEGKVATWIEIAFKIGELKADADYSLLLAGDREKSRIIKEQEHTIDLLKHPTNHGKECQCYDCCQRRKNEL